MPKAAKATLWISARKEVEIEAEVEVADLTDAQLEACIQEAHERGLLNSIETPITVQRQELLRDTLEELLRGRASRAVEKFRAAILAGLHPALLDAWQALEEGRNSAAICLIDRVLEPSDAASATSIPSANQARAA